MKAIAVHPGKPNSIHLADIPEPSVEDIPDGRGVLVEVLRVGVDGTDKEINEAKYGAAPPGYDFLVTGHENFGRVLEVGPNVPSTIKPGGFVVSTVRRPGHSIYDQIGLQDMTTDDTYYERGINLLHGYLTERYVEDRDYVVPLPDSLREVGALLEPTAVAGKGRNQACETQSGPGGDREAEVPADRINQGFVLGNKVMVGTVNASREDFERGVTDLIRAEAIYSGWLGKLLTTPVQGLDRYREMIEHLERADGI